MSESKQSPALASYGPQCFPSAPPPPDLRRRLREACGASVRDIARAYFVPIDVIEQWEAVTNPPDWPRQLDVFLYVVMSQDAPEVAAEDEAWWRQVRQYGDHEEYARLHPDCWGRCPNC